MTDSNAPRNVVTSDFFAATSTLASSTLPACNTSKRTVVLHGTYAGEALGESGHEASREFTFPRNSLRVPLSLATRCKKLEENMLSSVMEKKTICHIQTLPLN